MSSAQKPTSGSLPTSNTSGNAPAANDHVPSTQHGAAKPAPMNTALRSTSGRVIKRAVDVAIALPIVVIVLPPLCVLCWLIHLLQSSGPLFYRQVRCGRDKQPFMIYKFRTMNVPDTGTCEIKDAEVRIFSLGKILRASKIDEFPQFLNVLRGSMSVVGPRPHHFDDCEMFEKIVEDYKHRTIAKPGITGLAQYEEYNEQFEYNCVESRVSGDLRYIDQWTPATDIVLIIKTGAVVLRKILRAVVRRTLRRTAGPALRIVGRDRQQNANDAAANDQEMTDRKAA